MHKRIDLAKTLFIDIETVPEAIAYTELDPTWQAFWDDKWKKTRTNRYKHVFEGDMPDVELADLPAEAAQAYKEAGLYAEFGKICCITVGLFKEYHTEPGQRHLQLTSFYGEDERLILDTVSKGIKGKSETSNTGRASRFDWNILGHNVKEFDVPYLCRRLLVHGLEFPPMLDIAGLKPWDVTHIVDTMELWKFGDYKNYTPLSLLAHRFGIPSPKDAMDGSEVYEYYRTGRLAAIADYCAKDVKTLAQLMLRWRGEELLTDDEVEIVLRPQPIPTTNS
jgi:hypothetical protein